MFKNKIAGAALALVLGLGGAVALSAPATAHTPGATASCAGVVLHATNYDGSQKNLWSATIGGETKSGTFGSTLDKTFTVPQDGAITSWSVKIEDANHTPAYSKFDSGKVGPCGTPPVVVPDKPTPVVESVPVTSKDCTSHVVTTVTTTTTTDWVLVENVWVKGAPVITTATTTSPTTAEDCPVEETPPTDTPPTDTPPVVTPPTTYPENPTPQPETPVYVPEAPPVTVTPPATPEAAPVPTPQTPQALRTAPVADSKVLASTGAEIGVWLGLGVLLLLIGTIVVFISKRRAARE
jgi:hypothetical protein